MREPEDSHGLGPDGDQAFEERDDLLYRRGGLQRLQPGDDADPAGDAVILLRGGGLIKFIKQHEGK